MDCEKKYEEKLDPLTMRKAVEMAKNKVKENKNAKIRLLQQRCRRLEKRVECLEEVLNNARERNMLSQAATDQLFAVSNAFIFYFLKLLSGTLAIFCIFHAVPKLLDGIK